MNVLQMVKEAQQKREARFVAEKLHAMAYRSTHYTPRNVEFSRHIPGSCTYRGCSY